MAATHDHVAVALFAAIAVLVGADLLSDAGSGAGLAHVGAEAAGAAVAVAGAAWFLRRTWLERREAAAWRAQAEALLGGVGRTVEAQFATWGLSEAEREVGLLLIKGLALKEIAQVRATTERTARDQARAVYRKAGVAGRAELSAWFLEDWLSPRPPDGG